MAHKNWIRALAVRLSASLWAQRMLDQGILFAQGLMGIGSGGAPSWSGEIVLASLLRQLYSQTDGALCVFDVGANRGEFLDDVLGPVDSAGIPLEIHAFEPARAAFQKLQERFGEHPGIHLNNLGLGSRAGESDLFSDAGGSALASLSHRRLDHLGIDFSHTERVQIELLDDYCRRLHISRIDLLKLDVEGHELDVLEGARRMLSERRIRLVSFEFGGADIDSRTYFQDFWYFFRDYDPARLNRITPSGLLVPLDHYRESFEQFRTSNYVVLLS